MIRVQGKLPRNIVVACSGGADSVAVAHFLSRNHNVTLVWVNHFTSDSIKGYEHIVRSLKNACMCFPINPLVPKGVSQEEHWRNERYKIFHNIEAPVVTAHHLDDCVETWVWSSLHGEGKLIPYSNKNVIRPFRLNKKSVFYDYCKRHNLSWYEDKSNTDTKYTRNYIRHKMMPSILMVNPGIHKVVAKKILANP